MLVLLFDIMGFGIVGGYLSKLCVTLPHMSIGTRVVVAVPFHQIDNTPDAKTGSDCHHEGLQDRNCGTKKCHINT